MDTTGTTIAMCFYNIATHPEKAEILFKEINSFENKLNFPDLSKMDYTTAFIKETLRIYPPVPNAIQRIPLTKMKLGQFEID